MKPKSLFAADRRHHICLRDAKEHCRPIQAARLLPSSVPIERQPDGLNETGAENTHHLRSSIDERARDSLAHQPRVASSIDRDGEH